jgi:hypothetical protein
VLMRRSIAPSDSDESTISLDSAVVDGDAQD